MLKEHETILGFIDEINAKRFCEIGVWKGDLARLVIPKVEKYVGIDPYKDFDPAGGKMTRLYREKGNYKKIWEDLYLKVSSELSQYDNAVLLREISSNAVFRFPDGYFDIVYIDGNHIYENVRQDIMLWEPKIREGGILCGHDYATRNYPDVKRAVDEMPFSITLHPTKIWRKEK